MVLGSTQPLTEMSTRNLSWGLRRPVRRADNLTIFMCWLSGNSGSLNILDRYRLVQASNGIALPLFLGCCYVRTPGRTERTSALPEAAPRGRGCRASVERHCPPPLTLSAVLHHFQCCRRVMRDYRPDRRRMLVLLSRQIWPPLKQKDSPFAPRAIEWMSSPTNSPSSAARSACRRCACVYGRGGGKGEVKRNSRTGASWRILVKTTQATCI